MRGRGLLSECSVILYGRLTDDAAEFDILSIDHFEVWARENSHGEVLCDRRDILNFWRLNAFNDKEQRICQSSAKGKNGCGFWLAFILSRQNWRDALKA